MADSKYLELLALKYPNHRAVTTEIINLRAIMALPKATEFFLSDIHGEYEAFEYFVRSGAGIIRFRIDEAFKGVLSEADCDDLASLIYNPKAEIARREKSEKDFDEWCETAIYRLIAVARRAASKYTRSKVRKILPDNTGYIMDELLYADDADERTMYYKMIIESVIENDSAKTLICEIADTITELTIDSLHIIGDIYDRGPKPHTIIDFLKERKDVDIQWGNHDILWMGAACGNRACIANMIRVNVRYNNFDMLEYGYGINLRPLATLAEKIYGDDPCEYFQPNVFDKNRYDPIPEDLAAMMNKMITIIQFKLEAKLIKENPIFNMEHRVFLDKIDYDKGTVNVYGKEYKLRDTNFPTIDPANPFELTQEEEEVMIALEASILASEKLQDHLKYLYNHGSLYQISNGNLFYHGCIPFNEDGTYTDVDVYGESFAGAEYMKVMDKLAKEVYFDNPQGPERAEAANIMWYMWCGKDSPLFGKDRMTTFERLFIADKETHIENNNPYYRCIENPEIAEKILKDFGLNPDTGRILNGHVPVKIKDGESPIKGGGKVIFIDGGISKAYQRTTGIAGYTAIFTSKHLYLAEHEPYEPINKDGTQVFHNPKMHTIDIMPRRVCIKDTDKGDVFREDIKVLKELLDAYRKGTIKEHFPKKGKYYSK